jgi:hypothetical protein
MPLEMSSSALFLLLLTLVGSALALGTAVGRKLRPQVGERRESVGVVQGALLGLVGLILAFGLSMAVSRYDTRRVIVVQEANTIGTTYLRAQLLAEPVRSASLDALRDYADLAVMLADQVPESDSFVDTSEAMTDLQDNLWRLAGQAVTDDPQGSAPRLYIDTLNEMIDSHTARVASLRNHVPGTVLAIEILGAMIALGILALQLSMLGRAFTTTVLAGAFVVLILFITYDLDRPQRGLIEVPFRVLVEAREAMDGPPAFAPPP